MTGFLLGTWIACQSLDLTTTVIAKHRGFVEVNPLMQTQGVTIKVSADLISLWVWHRARPRPKNALAFAGTLAGCVPAASNIYQMRSR